MNKSFPKVNGSAQVMLDVINAILEVPNGMIIVDLMACEGSVTSQLNVGQKVYVDVQKRDIKNFEKHKDVVVTMDAIQYLQNTDKRFNAAICLDGIEHISKDNGLAMLELMKLKSNTQIIFTPLGDYLIETESSENPDAHRSGWTPDEFEKMGWATVSFPNFHPTLNHGGFFAYNHKDISNESNRVINELNQKSWAK